MVRQCRHRVEAACQRAGSACLEGRQSVSRQSSTVSRRRRPGDCGSAQRGAMARGRGRRRTAEKAAREARELGRRVSERNIMAAVVVIGDAVADVVLSSGAFFPSRATRRCASALHVRRPITTRWRRWPATTSDTASARLSTAPFRPLFFSQTHSHTSRGVICSLALLARSHSVHRAPVVHSAPASRYLQNIGIVSPSSDCPSVA